MNFTFARLLEQVHFRKACEASKLWLRGFSSKCTCLSRLAEQGHVLHEASRASILLRGFSHK